MLPGLAGPAPSDRTPPGTKPTIECRATLTAEPAAARPPALAARTSSRPPVSPTGNCRGGGRTIARIAFRARRRECCPMLPEAPIYRHFLFVRRLMKVAVSGPLAGQAISSDRRTRDCVSAGNVATVRMSVAASRAPPRIIHNSVSGSWRFPRTGRAMSLSAAERIGLNWRSRLRGVCEPAAAAGRRCVCRGRRRRSRTRRSHGRCRR